MLIDLDAPLCYNALRTAVMGNQPVSLFSAIHALFATFTFRRPCYHLPFSATVASSPVSASSRLPSSLPENAHLPFLLRVR